jgi:NNP family nitrate/nitrite transporter-like MFS transporter
MKANRLNLFDFTTRPMRAFHVTWVSFFLCFFAWFGMAPLMPIVRNELHLSKEQIGNIMIASVAVTIFARLVVGWLCDRFGPRRVYAGLLAIGALPVIGIGLAHDYMSFLVFRLAIGAIGASFVITQFHTSSMFASNVVGTANATAAGWGNLGGGVAQIVMPLLFAGLMGFGVAEGSAWRVAMIVPGVLMLLASVAYLTLTTDGPDGDQKRPATGSKGSLATFGRAAKDPRTWVLGLAYGACFGVELTVHNMAALYFHDRFQLDLKTAGLVAGTFGVLALFARTLGGYTGDRVGARLGLRGRVLTLAGLLAAEGLMLVLFSQMGSLPLAIASLIVFGLFTHMSAGATYAVSPFLRRDAVGAVAGIVGAGGNIGAVAAGFLFRSSSFSTTAALFALGLTVVACAVLVLTVRFAPADEAALRSELAKSPEPEPEPALANALTAAE